WDRQQLERGIDDGAKRAKRSAGELAEIVPSDVLHDMAASLDDSSVSECHRDADQQITWCAVAMAHRPGVIRGDDPTDRRPVKSAVDRQPLPMPRQLTIELPK